MTLNENEGCHYVNVGRDLSGRVAEAADWIDHERRLPSNLVAEMADQGLFRLLVPRSVGGVQLDFMSYLKIVELFARADGSTAWCLNQNNVFVTDAVRMPEETALEIWSDPMAIVSNGVPHAPVFAIPTEGGYRITGRWDFSSGINHATWVAALAYEGRPGVDSNEDLGDKREVVLLIPKSQVEILDIWQVNGLRGTGSHSFKVEDVDVPAVRSFGVEDDARNEGPLYWVPKVLLFSSGFAAVALGVARSGLDAVRDIPNKHASSVQRRVGEAEAMWMSAKAFLNDAAGNLWTSVITSGAITTEERIRLRLASTYGIRTAVGVATTAYELAGADGIFEGHPIQRRLQDTQVIMQQVQGRATHYETAGRHFLGLELGSTYY